MALDMGMFETINPSRFITFTIPSPPLSHHDHHNDNHLLRVAVLDSPVQLSDSLAQPQVALMFVPKHREHDWIFSTESGHLQLLLSCHQFSRLILIGDEPTTDDSPDLAITTKHDSFDQKSLEDSVKPLVIALSRKFCFDKNGIYNVPLLSYEDNVVSSVVLEKCVGDFAGEMLVEDVEIESEGGECRKREFRRRLRFKRMPNLVQTEVKLVPEAAISLDSVKIGGKVRFRPHIGVLVHVYLVPMVASCALIGSYIGERIRFGFRPKALCVGVGGGALVSFLRTQLDFEVVGVEMDEVVLRVARQYFGLEDGEFLRVSVGDAIEFLEKLARQIVGKNPDSFGACSLKDVRWGPSKRKKDLRKAFWLVVKTEIKTNPFLVF